MDFKGPEAGCPAAFAGCLDVDGGIALASYLRRSQGWQREAWTRCGPAPVMDAGRPDGG